jgi:hypothetical protein
MSNKLSASRNASTSGETLVDVGETWTGEGTHTDATIRVGNKELPNAGLCTLRLEFRCLGDLLEWLRRSDSHPPLGARPVDGGDSHIKASRQFIARQENSIPEPLRLKAFQEVEL